MLPCEPTGAGAFVTSFLCPCTRGKKGSHPAEREMAYEAARSRPPDEAREAWDAKVPEAQLSTLRLRGTTDRQLLFGRTKTNPEGRATRSPHKRVQPQPRQSGARNETRQSKPLSFREGSNKGRPISTRQNLAELIFPDLTRHVSWIWRVRKRAML